MGGAGGRSQELRTQHMRMRLKRELHHFLMEMGNGSDGVATGGEAEGRVLD